MNKKIKRYPLKTKTLAAAGAILLSALVFVKCTKQGTNAAALDRSVTADVFDSTVFSPFYDSTLIPYANSPASINDYIVTTGVLNIITNRCASADCHGGNISPALTNYAAIKSLAVAGNPQQSKLWQLITTNDLNKAMPPVNHAELALGEKNEIYNWIENGAKENPDAGDFRPAAVRVITNGCTSANCHSSVKTVGYWARAGLVTLSGASDTASVKIGTTTYVEVTNQAQLIKWWGGDVPTYTVAAGSVAYKDSVRAYYGQITDWNGVVNNNTQYKPWKGFNLPSSMRGPLDSYDNVIFDICYPKGQRSTSGNVNADNLAGQNVLNYIDSTLQVRNPRASASNGNFSNASGGMANSDGGLNNSDVALIKAWYFTDPNIPDVWKFGINGAGIFKYKSTGTIITKQ